MKRTILLFLVTILILSGYRYAIADGADTGKPFGIGIALEPTNSIWYFLTPGLKLKFWLIPNTVGFEIIGMPTSGGGWYSMKVLAKLSSTQYNRSYLGIGIPSSSDTVANESGSYNVFIGFENFWKNMPAVATSYEMGLYKIENNTITFGAFAYNLYF